MQSYAILRPAFLFTTGDASASLLSCPAGLAWHVPQDRLRPRPCRKSVAGRAGARVCGEPWPFSTCDRLSVTTDGWVDDEHLHAIGRVVVAATWLETVLDHVVRSLVDDGPVYWEMVSGLQVSQLCDLAVRLAEQVVVDPVAVKDLKAWTADIKRISQQRNQLLHAGYLGSEGGEGEARTLVIEVRGKRRVPSYAMTASVEALLELAERIDEVSSRGTELTGRLVAGYVGRGHR